MPAARPVTAAETASAAGRVPQAVQAASAARRYSTRKSDSPAEASVQVRLTALAEVAAAASPVGAAGGMVSETAEVTFDPFAFRAVTWNS